MTRAIKILRRTVTFDTRTAETPLRIGLSSLPYSPRGLVRTFRMRFMKQTMALVVQASLADFLWVESLFLAEYSASRQIHFP